MHFLNLGILAHVDAGKTSLTERLLHAAGVIDDIGSVDAGSTQTDSMDLERQRGITIKAAVVSFRVADDVTVNLIDTPGHPDFIAEVERALSVLDGAVLVVSAVEGVQAQTRVLMRALARMRLPTLVFLNKTDRRNADPERVLAEQDPLINLRRGRDGLAVSLYGEVQKEVIEATLRKEYGIDVTFRESTTIHVERLVGNGSAEEVIATGDNPFLATVGLRVDPAPPGSGQTFRLEVELGSMPYAFFAAVEETVHRALAEGPHGWQVVDCTVTMTRSGYWARQSHSHGSFDKSMSSTAGDFRNLTPLVLMDALRRAGTRVHEPVHVFHLDCPADLLPALLPTLARLRAVPLGATGREITGEIPAASVHDLQVALPALTRGEGTLETTFDHYQPVAGPPPLRPRTDHNPLNRKEYLLAVVRRVT